MSAFTLAIALSNASPAADPQLTPFPNLVPTSPVDLATDNRGSQTISPLRIPAQAVTVAKRGEAVTVDGVVYSTGYSDLVPTSTVDLATDSTFSTQIVSPTRVLLAASTTAVGTEVIIASSAFVISSSTYPANAANTTSCVSTTALPATLDGILYTTGFPAVVPSTTLNMATESTFTTQNVSPTRLAAATASTALGDSNDGKKVTNGASGLKPPFMGLLGGVWRLCARGNGYWGALN
ncbi:hypothetical protein LTR91_003731 [Friedmanniomyces endolithicus]|uniref:Uncharacterized protein n=1 Tax=Friedmanniomyces endolithicus TaxID=329885 RepID=A0AAN6KXX9_9PEZI|nr:hypothetical protein LTR75_012027 [Friedmanniomyces endolithicus]KAK0837614.1 hypothetical protein LTR03_012664 [Friedmanniomyces endolithicus]KAK0859462.1 hypothetical protein LTS02_009178 [Friedmanniomyces endolithicus]KAK0875075.1 hypothetical protein LTR87_011077 [Friedmanniomyces endolithicus]KAK0889476.1 hypothetical protein LTR02_015423 [Friedmanniomyces endolithicus]